MFHIEVSDLQWIDGSEDDPTDLCLHGSVCVRFVDKLLREEISNVSFDAIL